MEDRPRPPLTASAHHAAGQGPGRLGRAGRGRRHALRRDAHLRHLDDRLDHRLHVVLLRGVQAVLQDAARRVHEGRHLLLHGHVLRVRVLRAARVHGRQRRQQQLRHGSSGLASGERGRAVQVADASAGVACGTTSRRRVRSRQVCKWMCVYVLTRLEMRLAWCRASVVGAAHAPSAC